MPEVKAFVARKHPPLLHGLKALPFWMALIGAPAFAQGDTHAGHHPATVAADAPAAVPNCPAMSSQGGMMSGQGGGMMQGGMMQGGTMQGGGMMGGGGMGQGGMMSNAQAMSSDIKALRQEIAALRVELRQRRGR